MYDFNKPDLFVHPSYYTTVKYAFNLHASFNVLSLSDLSASIPVNYLITDDAIKPVTVYVDPRYADRLIRESGGDPSRTSYWHEQREAMYRLNYTGPRYVIWTTADNLTICGTRVDRVEPYQLYLAVQRAKEWSYMIERSRSIIVFDLDDTLIDSNDRALDGASEVLARARARYDLMVLWSHGSPLHVDEQLGQFDARLFDLVLRNDDGCVPVNKNLLHLYNYFPGCRFDDARLVDDTACNWTPEYTDMLLPARDIKSVRAALSLL